MFQRAGGVGHDLAAGPRLAGQRDLGDAGMPGQQPAGLGIALHHREQAVRRARFAQDVFQMRSGERGQLGGLEDHGIAAGERGRGLPAGDLQRIVPRADACDHAERLAARIAERGRAEIGLLAGQRCRKGGKILEAVGAGEHIDGDGLLDRLAGVAGFEFCQLWVACAQDVGDAPQDACALSAGHRGPACLRRSRGADRAVDIRRSCDGEFGEHLAIGRIDRGDARCAALLFILGRAVTRHHSAGAHRHGQLRGRGAEEMQVTIDEAGSELPGIDALGLAVP